jgi:hypothetical protein
VLGLIELEDNELTVKIDQERSPTLGWLSCDQKGRSRGGALGTYRDMLPPAIAAGRYGPEKKTVLAYRGWPITIVSNQGDPEIRRFLRARGYRTKAAGWNPEEFWGFANLSARVSFYTARGDAGLVARRDIQVRLTFGDLALVVAGITSLKELLHRAPKKNSDVPGVSLEAGVIDQGRETL